LDTWWASQWTLIGRRSLRKQFEMGEEASRRTIAKPNELQQSSLSFQSLSIGNFLPLDIFVNLRSLNDVLMLPLGSISPVSLSLSLLEK